MGEALGRAGVSVEGGGAFVVNGVEVAHFLFVDGGAARRALDAAGILILEELDVRATTESIRTGSAQQDLARDGRGWR